MGGSRTRNLTWGSTSISQRGVYARSRSQRTVGHARRRTYGEPATATPPLSISPHARSARRRHSWTGGVGGEHGLAFASGGGDRGVGLGRRGCGRTCDRGGLLGSVLGA